MNSRLLALGVVEVELKVVKARSDVLMSLYAEVQRHALSLRSPEAIASHLSLLPRIGTPDGLRLLLCFC